MQVGYSMCGLFVYHTAQVGGVELSGVKYHISIMREVLLPSSSLSGLLQRVGSLIYACAKLVFASVEKVLMETGGGFGT